MSPKFFLFNKEPINTGSTTESDSGVGLSIIALQAQNLSYISAKRAMVTLVFSNSGVYEFVQLTDNEGFKKTIIDVACEPGEEQSLIQEILNFISSSSTNKTVMNFVYSGNSSFSKAEVTTTKDISSKVHISPELLAPKKLLLRETGLTSFVIDGIEFSESSYPVVDYSPIGIPTGGTALAATGGVGLTYVFNQTTWTNNSQLPNNVGPTGYDLINALVSGPTRVNPGVASSTGVGTTGMLFSKSRFMQLPSKLEIQGSYTTYITFGIPDDTTTIDSIGSALSRIEYRTLGAFYGDFDGSTTGFVPFTTSGFAIRHAGKTGSPVIKTTIGEEGGSVSYKTPDNSGVGVQQTCYVFIVRRDDKFNVFLHNHEGDIVCVIPASTGTSNATDGTFSFLTLGYGEFDTSKVNEFDQFWGVITRFGIIPSDIGPSEASRLARALYEKYKPLK